MVGLLHYLYSLQADFYTSENLINIDGPKFLKIIVRVRKYHTVYTHNLRITIVIFFTLGMVQTLSDEGTCTCIQGRIQDFKLGGGALKKIAPSGGRREHFGGISCEKSRFYTKKSYFFQLRREARKFLGYFV